MLITINKVDYECIKFKPGEYHNLEIVVEGDLSKTEHNIDIKYGGFIGFGYKMLPNYTEESNLTSFLVYIYQPGDTELDTNV